MHCHAVEYSTYPRGPRSGPSCSVPVRHHLFGPIRPTRRHIAISLPHDNQGENPYCLTQECSPERNCCLIENVPVASCCSRASD